MDAPKAGTREAAFVNALSGSGKTLAQLAQKFDWQPHTVRAAMSRLRQRGYTVERTSKTDKSASKFRIAKPAT
ncbi:MAG: DUF3489 domain-containing protein [Pseudomonadota bacterium]